MSADSFLHLCRHYSKVLAMQLELHRDARGGSVGCKMCCRYLGGLAKSGGGGGGGGGGVCWGQSDAFGSSIPRTLIWGISPVLSSFS